MDKTENKKVSLLGAIISVLIILFVFVFYLLLATTIKFKDNSGEITTAFISFSPPFGIASLLASVFATFILVWGIKKKPKGFWWKTISGGKLLFIMDFLPFRYLFFYGYV